MKNNVSTAWNLCKVEDVVPGLMNVHNGTSVLYISSVKTIDGQFKITTLIVESGRPVAVYVDINRAKAEYMTGEMLIRPA